MSGPNAALSLPLDERPPAYQPDAPSVAPQAPSIPPGLQLEVDRIGPLLDDAVMKWARERSTTNLASLEACLTKLEATIAHARKTVTSLRVLKRKPSTE